MKLIVSAIFALGALVPIGAGYHAHQQASGVGPEPGVVVQAPLAPARLTEGQALAVVQANHDPQLLTHPYSVVYGSALPANNESVRTPDGLVPVPRRDVWEITVTGLDFPRPCMGAAGCPPNAHTLVIFIDDKTGQQSEEEAW